MTENDELHAIRPQYFTPREVAIHNLAKDCWVSIHYRVFDITPLISDHPGVLVQPLIQHAGEDISHWFDPQTNDIKYYVDPERNDFTPFVPYGQFLHVPPPISNTQWRTTDFVPWWRDSKYIIGRLTKKTRWLEIVNMLTQQQHALEVCCEETISEIQKRYLYFNAHAGSYTWKYLEGDGFVPLKMQCTLEENGIVDETPLFEQFDMDEQLYKPILHIYFNDDLTVM
ncbi:cytochrome b5 domain-containing protein 1-like [Plasmopara halstedii]|uniref:Cytochrome b5 domain-containing protein 1 n=1 Tax=Plasmopara halstedii TaxID=4781 RepID=A0A0N7L7G6_PLAHL|nr:cytochrome b5 domain-containing protein 1-like [Plasmopara halstedii]CEG47019.1 cytochrome b5 domain-containing protein 1-like [Plasmopara halstedii]|eukprot:XP_024583388.1 cytochrome b5 domain-containing protein 1-like [Plasmopara halstedii]